MKRRFILYRRKLGGTFYVEDTQTRKQESLGTKDRAEATSLWWWGGNCGVVSFETNRHSCSIPTLASIPNRLSGKGFVA